MMMLGARRTADHTRRCFALCLQARPPMLPTHVFLVDVSYTAMSTGATASACASIASILDCLQGVPWLVHHFLRFLLNNIQRPDERCIAMCPNAMLHHSQSTISRWCHHYPSAVAGVVCVCVNEHPFSNKAEQSCLP
jgi:hypothetical protein